MHARYTYLGLLIVRDDIRDEKNAHFTQTHVEAAVVVGSTRNIVILTFRHNMLLSELGRYNKYSDQILGRHEITYSKMLRYIYYYSK